MRKKLTYERLHELLDYDPETGIFVWKVKRNHLSPAGRVAGCKDSNGYVRINVDGVRCWAQRLAWFYAHGYFPEAEIDHINRVRDDNRLCNLREVSRLCNIRNAKQRDSNTSGVTGVSWGKQQGKWYAYISLNDRTRSLGHYDDFDEAVCVRLAVEQCLNWDGCDSSSDAYRYVNDPYLFKYTAGCAG